MAARKQRRADPLKEFERAQKRAREDPRIGQLVRAAGKGDVEAVGRLLDSGADPDARDPDADGYPSPVWAAVYARKPEVIRLLAAADADLDAGFPYTPLGAAVNYRNLELIRALVEGGADVNRADNSDETPLLIAVTDEDVDTAAELVRLGADIRRAGKKKKYETITNYSPLEYARKTGNKKLVEALGVDAGKVKPPAPPKAPRAPKRPRGVTTFDTNDAAVLIAADVNEVAGAFAKSIGAKTWEKDVLGEKVKLAKRSYAVFKLAGSPWSAIMKLSCANFRQWPAAPDAQALSKSLKTRGLLVANSDTADVTQYALFDSGELVEVFDSGSTDEDENPKVVTRRFAKYYGLDMSGIPGGVSLGKYRVFASALRTVDLAKIKNDLDFVNDFVKKQGALVPLGVGDWGQPGEMIELSLEGLVNADEVERLDYVAVR
jgi:hypothetical protein